MTEDHPERTPAAATTILAALAAGHTPTKAATAAGLTLAELRRWQADDVRFADRMADALDAGTDLLEDEVFRRAVIGVETPIVNRKTGEIEGYATKYSDMLLVRLLGARNPTRWREASRGASPGDVATAPAGMGLDLSGLTLEEQRTFRDLLARAEQRAAERAQTIRQSRATRSDLSLH